MSSLAVARSTRSRGKVRSLRRTGSRVAVHAVLVVVCVVWLVPTLSLLATSLRPAALLLSSGWWHVFDSPSQVTIENFHQVLGRDHLGQSFINSLAIVVPVTALTVLLGAIGGYTFAWLPFPGERLILIGLVGLLGLPVQVTLVPVLQLFSHLNLAGHFAAAWIAYTGYTLPFAIYLMRSFFRRIPREIIEAAQVDSASAVKICLRVAMPLAAPALASLATLVFVWTWNDLLVSLVYVGSGPQVAPMPVTIANLIGSQGEGQQLLAAGAVISLLLPVAVFFALQRYFVRGIVAGAVKG